MILIVMFLGLVALVLINVPIAISLGVVAIFAMAISSGLGGLPNAALVLYSGTLKFALIAIPLFILAGGHHERVGDFQALDQPRQRARWVHSRGAGNGDGQRVSLLCGDFWIRSG